MPEKKSKTKFIVIAAITLVALTATGGGIWLYQDAKITEEAEGLATRLTEAQVSTNVQIGLNVDLLAEARQANEGMAPATEILESKPEVFDSEQSENFMGAFNEVGAHAAKADPVMPTLSAPFDAADLEESFVEHFRQANSDERDALRDEHAAIMAQLRDFDAALIDEGATVHMTVKGAHDTVTALLDSLPTTAEILTADLKEASEDSVTAVHAAALYEPTNLDDFPAMLETLTDHLIVYVEKVGLAQTSHKEAVEAREKAEREAAEREAAKKAAAAKQSASKSSSTRMCTRVRPGFGGNAMTLVLVPCSR